MHRLSHFHSNPPSTTILAAFVKYLSSSDITRVNFVTNAIVVMTRPNKVFGVHS
ncbi:hypothetical protein SAMN05421539_11834 [Jannaschia seohaensis]|uniref:Uncharacterized protein n=1 Tax=Jannaschia seohaensis TaxID=475081 RepID=A0A2Y9C942_9RHOB|nr:hypothetical protein BCF38_11834 [Jannaschia seohaensis]SSA51283.1 hypothetical protein SAMN05421539_11834 [Jannaschia seohaensis]